MRSTENVRGEWDELGERDARVIVPGPGAGDTAPAVEAPPVAGAPAEVDVPAVVDVPPAVEDDIPADLGPALDAVAGVGRATPVDGGRGPDLDLGPGLGAVPEPAPGPGLTDLDLGMDPEPVRGPDLEKPELEVAPGPADLDPDPDPGLDPDPDPGTEPLSEPGPASEPEPGPRGLGLGLEPEPLGGPELMDPVPVPESEREPGPWPVSGAGAGADSETGPVPVGQGPAPADQGPAPAGPGDRPGGDGPGDGPPDLRKPEPGGARPDGDEERAPVTLTVGTADPVAWWGADRRKPVIATEATAPIPVHLLFRDDDGQDSRSPGAGAGTARRPDERRPPLPRSRRTQGPTRPAPHADPRLAERPGPVLPGWAALFTAATGAVAGLTVLWWHGALPTAVTGRLGLGARPYDGIGTGAWALLALVVAVALFALCGLGRGRSGHASVLTLFGDYRGSARRTGLLWISPLLRRRRIDVRLRHWRSEPLAAADASGTALRAVVLVVWRVRDTARATFGVADHERYLRDQVESALARVLSQLPADAFHEPTRTLRDAEAVGDALTRMVKADCVPVGIEVYSAQPTGIEYAPEVAAAMHRCRVAAIDAIHRDEVLTSVVDAVDDTVGRLTARGIVELDDYEHKALVRDLTVAFYTGRSSGEGA
ncbi:SPFH domain-containing protein [Streptomyces sp. NPDC102441]|uniref:SPFH domain-containing protein n=1 Tax=Streptomyces sp. NPDC102441 TaxID=3366176 RepID=UPI00381992DE